MSADASAFTIHVPDTTLTDLRDRLARTRWPDAIDDGWTRGTSPSALRAVVERWAGGYDWHTSEARLNQLSHHIDGGLHHVRAGTRGRTPLLLLHGWPDSFLRFERILPLLADDFDLIVPSIPGYGFSERPAMPGAGPAHVADRLAELMGRIGHQRFAVHGGDLGSGIGEQLALRHGDRVTGLHLTDVPYSHLFAVDPSTLSVDERDFLQQGMAWSRSEGAYAMLQGTKPQTLAYSLNDSPAGLAGWFLEKFQAWSDRDAVDAIGIDTMLDNLTLYWVTETAGSAARYYFDTVTATDRSDGRVLVPTAMAIFPADIVPAPRVFAERWFDVHRWTEMPRGGHFAAWEEPQLLADDLRAFFLGG